MAVSRIPNWLDLPVGISVNDPFKIVLFYSHTKHFQYFSEESKKYWIPKGLTETSIFSNLHPCKIVIEETKDFFAGKTEFDSTEHYFQMYKYSQADRNFMELLSTNDVAAFGQRRLKFKKDHIQLLDKLSSEHKPIPLTKDNTPYTEGSVAQPILQRDQWQTECIPVMLAVLRDKFSRHEDLKSILLSTQGAWIIEHTENDAKWADGKKGTGTNYLGKLLMQVRHELVEGKKIEVDNEFLSIPMKDLLDYSS